jgi:hypothetical protein
MGETPEMIAQRHQQELQQQLQRHQMELAQSQQVHSQKLNQAQEAAQAKAALQMSRMQRGE